MPPRNIEQDLDGKGLGIGVVAARFNGYITDQMTEITVSRLQELGVAGDDIVLIRTPGAFELPLGRAGLPNAAISTQSSVSEPLLGATPIIMTMLPTQLLKE